MYANQPGLCKRRYNLPALFEKNHEINFWSHWLAACDVWNHVQSNWNLFHVDKATRDGGRCICLWKWSQWGALFKHEWASDSRKDNTRGLIITAEYNNSVVGLKSPSRGVILDLIKCGMYRLPGLLLKATHHGVGGIGFPLRSWMTLGHSVNHVM